MRFWFLVFLVLLFMKCAAQAAEIRRLRKKISTMAAMMDMRLSWLDLLSESTARECGAFGLMQMSLWCEREAKRIITEILIQKKKTTLMVNAPTTEQIKKALKTSQETLEKARADEEDLPTEVQVTPPQRGV